MGPRLGLRLMSRLGPRLEWAERPRLAAEAERPRPRLVAEAKIPPGDPSYLVLGTHLAPSNITSASAFRELTSILGTIHVRDVM